MNAYGVAIDVGSTTIAAYLCDLATGDDARLRRRDEPADPLRRRPDEPRLLRDDEPGRRRGAHARRARGDRRADRRGRGRRPGVARERIVEITLVGNPIMHHLALGLDPTELGGAPFALAIDGAVEVKARDLGLAVAPGAYRLRAALHRRPCRRRRGRGHARRGAASRATNCRLIVDVGTNAEIVFGDRSGCWRPPRRPARPSRARRSPAASAPRPARSSACASTARRSSRASR